jgi:hypothetical protein
MTNGRNSDSYQRRESHTQKYRSNHCNGHALHEGSKYPTQYKQLEGLVWVSCLMPEHDDLNGPGLVDHVIENQRHPNDVKDIEA